MRLFFPEHLGGKEISLDEGDEVVVENPNDRAWLILFFTNNEREGTNLLFANGDNKMLLQALTETDAMKEVNQLIRPLEFELTDQRRLNGCRTMFTLRRIST